MKCSALAPQSKRPQSWLVMSCLRRPQRVIHQRFFFSMCCVYSIFQVDPPDPRARVSQSMSSTEVSALG